MSLASSCSFVAILCGGTAGRHLWAESSSWLSGLLDCELMHFCTKLPALRLSYSFSKSSKTDSKGWRGWCQEGEESHSKPNGSQTLQGEISWENFSLSTLPRNMYQWEGSYIWLTLGLRNFPNLRWLTRQVPRELPSGMAVTITWIFLTIFKVLRTKHYCDPTFTTEGLSYV